VEKVGKELADKLDLVEAAKSVRIVSETMVTHIIFSHYSRLD
jgi:hypothetical protein